ncbi:Cro/Cl family transcriptional regulator [Massilia sp. CCM 8695]|uniref:Cro/Cl family transcriptional regulator n=1 Tax=Massilia frigida TaxID=2609281 RepID=A0ABX0NKK8_9BURK|nr:helix-turn-helix domain-containing protein [Massilia frigida]NHZ84163.1 Cro/Cl family transcriptional regulator [Massilia frigida]
MDKLLTYLNSLAKHQRRLFCESCKTTEGYLRKAISAKQLLRVTLCVAIERESKGAVTRIDLHPDDWLENWPELAFVGIQGRLDRKPHD